MGLRTASVRHPHVEVMAPALTETTKNHFSLPSKEQLENASHIESYEKSKCINPQQSYFQINKSKDISLSGINNECDCNKTNKSFSQLITQNGVNHNLVSNIMSSSSHSDVCNQENKMGLQKTVLTFSAMSRQKVKNMGHILSSNMESVISENDISCANDMEAHVEEIINNFKSSESEKVTTSANELSNDNEMFAMTGGELTNNFSPFEKDLLDNVDVMNIEMEDQHDDSVNIQKESHTKDLFLEMERKHVEIKRRLDFLRRRAHKLQSQLLGQHMSYEISGIFENVCRLLKKPKDIFEMNGSGLLSSEGFSVKNKPVSPICAKNFIRKLEITSLMQANSVSHHKICSKYFGSGSVEYPLLKNISCGSVNILPWPMDEKANMNKIASQLKTQLAVSQKELDSEATESSSGGESCDEVQNYINPHQQYLSVQKRALWRYSLDRATIAARWTWLQAQIADIEYRIRLHTELHKQIRTGKGAVGLENTTSSVSATSCQTVNGYRGQLSDRTSQEYQCARTKPLLDLKKRKLLQISGLHAVSKRAARPSTMKCGCIPFGIPCALCTGRNDPTYPRDSSDTLSRSEKIALLDPSFHPVFSLVEDTSQSFHLEAIMKTQEWQQRSTRMKTAKVLTKLERLETKSIENTNRRIENRKKYKLGRTATVSNFPEKLKHKLRGRRPYKNSVNRIHGKRLSDKDDSFATHIFSQDIADDEIEQICNNSNSGQKSFDSPNSSPLLQIHSIAGYNNKKFRIDSYDIDNIVIPYSVAASTRVEKLQYKEILTPKWRIADPCYENRFSNKNNGVRNFSDDSDVEDLTEEAVVARHDKCEHEEKKRFLSFLKVPAGYGRNRSHKRTDSRAESSGANTPDPMSPPNTDLQESANSPMTSPPATPLPIQMDDGIPLPSIAVMRRRTMSQSRFHKERELKEENLNSVLDIAEVAPFEKRSFPINDEMYEKMLKNMPENHQFATNSRSQDSSDQEEANLFDERVDSPDSESTESAIGDGEEDPNDPEWSDSERACKEKYKR